MPDNQSSVPRESERGREATRPQHIPLRGWKDVLVRSKNEISANNIFLASGGVTYAVLLALFPALAALVSIYGLVLDPRQIESQVNSLTGVLPEQSRQMLSQELHQLVSSSHSTLGINAVIGVLLALWSASRGMSGLMSALNIAYEESETRGFLEFNFVAVVLTLGLMAAGIIAVVLVAGLPAVVQVGGSGRSVKWLLLIVQWPILMILMTVGLATLYRYAPDRDAPQWRWLSPGAILGTVLWILASVAFTVYVANFSSYNTTYGSLGGAVVLLTWLYITSFTILLGAVVNAQAERQTRRDTTTEQPAPLGERNAHAADTVGPSSG
jgi:membrane protein